MARAVRGREQGRRGKVVQWFEGDRCNAVALRSACGVTRDARGAKSRYVQA